jgi:hypothetical protein
VRYAEDLPLISRPYLTIFGDRLECRVLLQKAIPIGEIENVDIWETLATRTLQIPPVGERVARSFGKNSRQNFTSPREDGRFQR